MSVNFRVEADSQDSSFRISSDSHHACAHEGRSPWRRQPPPTVRVSRSSQPGTQQSAIQRQRMGLCVLKHSAIGVPACEWHYSILRTFYTGYRWAMQFGLSDYQGCVKNGSDSGCPGYSQCPRATLKAPQAGAWSRSSRPHRSHSVHPSTYIDHLSF